MYHESPCPSARMPDRRRFKRYRSPSYGTPLPHQIGPTNPGSNQKPKPVPPGKPSRVSISYGPGNPGSGQKPPPKPRPKPNRTNPPVSHTTPFKDGLHYLRISDHFWPLLLLALLIQIISHQWLRHERRRSTSQGFLLFPHSNWMATRREHCLVTPRPSLSPLSGSH